jgi:molybdenum cofactor cytidylyltransferase
MKKLYAVILAAGSSKRLGSNKLTLRIDGEAVIRKAVMPFLSAGIEKILVVTGVNSQDIQKELAGYPVQFIENKEHLLGMSTSVRAALPFIRDAEGVFFHLGDKPFLEKEILYHMADMYRQNQKKTIVPVFQGKKGHPVLIDIKPCETVIESLSGDKGLREIIEKNGDDVICIKGDEGSLLDIDTEEDVISLRKRGYNIEKG